MRKRIIIYNDGKRAFIHGNITVKGNKPVSEEIMVEGSDVVTDAEFEQFALNPARTGVATFINKVRNEATAEKNKPKKPLKGGGKASIIPEEVSGLPNKEKTATF